MAWSEKEILDWFDAQLKDTLPERLHSTALMLVRDVLGQPGRSKMAVHEVLARVWEELRPSMTRDEWAEQIMRPMTDRQLLEAIYKKVVD